MALSSVNCKSQIDTTHKVLKSYVGLSLDEVMVDLDTTDQHELAATKVILRERGFPEGPCFYP